MNGWWLASYILLWASVLFVAFLVLGVLRNQGLLGWRLEQLELITPSRQGRGGLKPGTKAPDFVLPNINGSEVTLRQYTGRKVLLVFMEPGCRPCQAIIPELNRVRVAGQVEVLAVVSGALDAAKNWASQAQAAFDILVQENHSLSRKFQSFATPFAFFISEEGAVISKGVAGQKRYLRWVLEGSTPGTQGGSSATRKSDLAGVDL